jgi:hypothetical protein
LFDKKFLDHYVHNDPLDMSVMQEIFAAGQKQNDNDGATVVAMTKM